jgi:hypothetical protein
VKVARIADTVRPNPGSYVARVEQARRLGRMGRRLAGWIRGVTAEALRNNRTDRHRTRLPVQDSSRATTERRANHPNSSTMSNT